MEKLENLFNESFAKIEEIVSSHSTLNEKLLNNIKEVTNDLYEKIKFLTKYGFEITYYNGDHSNLYIILTKGSWTYRLCVPISVEQKTIEDGYIIESKSYNPTTQLYNLYIYRDDSVESSNERNYYCTTVDEVVQHIAKHSAFINSKRKK